jgi:hypothetical protein
MGRARQCADWGGADRAARCRAHAPLARGEREEGGMMFWFFALLVRLVPWPRFDIARTSEGPYNTRYTLVPRFVCKWFGKEGIFLHHFQQSDPTEDFHNHPYGSSWALVLAGGYREERLLFRSEFVRGLFYTITSDIRAGQVNRIDADTYHRIDLLDPRGCWTLFVAGKKTQAWGFLNRSTGDFRPWSGKKPTEFYEEGLR